MYPPMESLPLDTGYVTSVVIPVSRSAWALPVASSAYDSFDCSQFISSLAPKKKSVCLPKVRHVLVV